MSIDQLKQHRIFSGKPFGIMEGGDPYIKGHPGANHENLLNTLKQMGLEHEEMIGHYGNSPQKSVAIYNVPRETMTKLGKQFGQESVLYGNQGKHQLIYTNGPHEGEHHESLRGAKGLEMFDAPPDKYYTHIPGQGAFRVNFNSKRVKPITPVQSNTNEPLNRSDDVIFSAIGSINVSDEKTFTVEEAVELLKAETKKKLDGFAQELREFYKREKLDKNLVPPHKHNAGMTVGSGAEDVAPSKVNPPGIDKKELEKVTPPGISEETMHKLKAQYGGDKEKAYATAWKIHNDKAKKGEKSASEDSPDSKEETSGEHSPADIAAGKPDDSMKGIPMNKEELCKDCGKVHVHKAGVLCKDIPVPTDAALSEMSKSELVDSKGNRFDNGIDPDSVLPGDKKAQVVDAEGSGGQIKKAKSLKSIRKSAINMSKVEPPMAKPPSGKNMATHVPVSKPKAPQMAAAGTMQKAMSKEAKSHALSDAARAAASAPKEAEVKAKMPSPAEHQVRAENLSIKKDELPMKKSIGIFARLKAKMSPSQQPVQRSPITQPMPKIKPAGEKYAKVNANIGTDPDKKQLAPHEPTVAAAPKSIKNPKLPKV